MAKSNRKSTSTHSKASTSSTAAIEPGNAERAYESLRLELDALPSDGVEPARIDVQQAAAIVHSIAVRDAEESRRARFELLASVDLYDSARIDRLPTIALAAWHARRRQLTTTRLSSNAVLPSSLLQEGQQVRTRMLRVLEYWFGDHDTIAGELAAIRSGTGYQDLANDLDDLADLYARTSVRDLIAQDRKDYREGDIGEARRLSATIFTALGMDEDNEADGWTNASRRAWTLMLREYAAHRRAGEFLFGESEDTSDTYPSLFSAVRTSSGSRERAPQEDAGSPAAVAPESLRTPT
jgi:hypothetical protein